MQRAADRQISGEKAESESENSDPYDSHDSNDGEYDDIKVTQNEAAMESHMPSIHEQEEADDQESLGDADQDSENVMEGNEGQPGSA